MTTLSYVYFPVGAGFARQLFRLDETLIDRDRLIDSRPIPSFARLISVFHPLKFTIDFKRSGSNLSRCAKCKTSNSFSSPKLHAVCVAITTLPTPLPSSLKGFKIQSDHNLLVSLRSTHSVEFLQDLQRVTATFRRHFSPVATNKPEIPPHQQSHRTNKIIALDSLSPSVET